MNSRAVRLSATGPGAPGLPVIFPASTGGQAARGTRRMSATNDVQREKYRSNACHRMAHFAIATSIAMSAALTGGCVGHASVHIASLETRGISSTAPLVRRVTPDRCYYWINERDELCIAMRKNKPSLLGKQFGEEFRLSLVLDGLPAGSARNYGLSRRSLRAKQRIGYSHARTASMGGVAAVWNYGKGSLHGRFRTFVKQQSWSVLSGWGSNKKILMVGEFTAVRSQNAGEKLLTETESDGMERGYLPPRPRPVQGPPRPTMNSSP